MATVEERERTTRFARWLIQARKQAGISQAELARRGGVDRALINRIEALAEGRVSARTPYRPGALLPALYELTRLHRRDMVTEGLLVWGWPVPLDWNQQEAPEDLREWAPAPLAARGAAIDELTARIAQLPLRRRQLLSLLIDELAS